MKCSSQVSTNASFTLKYVTEINVCYTVIFTVIYQNDQKKYVCMENMY